MRTFLKFMPALLVAAAAIVSTSMSAQAVPVIVNGSFEIGPASSTRLSAGSTAIFGWTVGGIEIDYAKSNLFNASQGVASIDLDGSRVGRRDGAISQNIATVVGEQYIITFDLSGNSAGGPLIKPVRVSAGSTFQDFFYNVGAITPIPPATLPLSISYVSTTFAFTAVSTISTLTFASLTYNPSAPASTQFGTGFGAVIDNVSIALAPPPPPPVATPTPGSMALLGLGLIGIGGARRRPK